MKVLICGSRDWTDAKIISSRLRKLPRGTTIIHGGARGADLLAATISTALGFPVKEFKADWARYKRAAGPKRNIQMLDENPDLVIAFQKDGSTGTQHTIDNARKRGIEVEVFSE